MIGHGIEVTVQQSFWHNKTPRQTAIEQYFIIENQWNVYIFILDRTNYTPVTLFWQQVNQFFCCHIILATGQSVFLLSHYSGNGSISFFVELLALILCRALDKKASTTNLKSFDWLGLESNWGPQGQINALPWNYWCWLPTNVNLSTF